MLSAADQSAPEATASAAPPPSLARPALRASIWTIGGYGASQVLRLASNLVLSRLLFPAVFGEVALVFIFIQGLHMFSDVGIGPAIIQGSRGEDERFLKTAWTIGIARGFALWIASWAIAWPVAAFYGRPTLAWLIPAAGFTAVIGGFESTAQHALRRELRVERLTLLDLVTQLVGSLATVGFALLDRWWFGPNHPSAVWAILGGNIVSAVVRLAMTHAYLPGIRHRLHFERDAARHLYGFGRWIFVSSLLTFLSGQADRMLFGKLIPIALFGVYSIAWMLASLPTQAVLKLGSAVVFPAYSRLIERRDFSVLYWRMRFPLVLGGGALVGVLLAGGPFVVRVLYDQRYADAAWILQYLSASAWFQILESVNGAALLAKGRVRWMAAGSATKVLGMVVLIPVGYRMGGFVGALIGVVVSDVIKYLTSSVGARLAGLRGFGRDLVLTIAVAGTAAAGYGSGLRAAGIAGGGGVLRNLLALSVAVLVVLVPWAVAGLWYQLRVRRQPA